MATKAPALLERVTDKGSLFEWNVPLIEAEAEVKITAAEHGNQIHLAFYAAGYTGTEPGFKARWRLLYEEAREFRNHVAGTVRTMLHDKENGVVSFQLMRDVAIDIYFRSTDVDTLVRALDEALEVSRPRLAA